MSMKLKEERELEIPHGLQLQGITNVSLKAKYYTRRGAADFIEIHIYQPDGKESHRMSKFRVTDENEKECVYIETRGRNEPYKMALIGLHLYGWDATNVNTPDERDTSRDPLVGSGPLGDPEKEEFLKRIVKAFGDLQDSTHDPMIREAASRTMNYATVTLALMDYYIENEHSLQEAIESGGRNAFSGISFTMYGSGDRKEAIRSLIDVIQATTDYEVLREEEEETEERATDEQVQDLSELLDE